MLAALLGAVAAQAAMPREIRRAFLDAGMPLTHVSIVVQDTAKPRPLFVYQPDLPRNPASVMKLVTTYARWSSSVADYRWKTEAYLGRRARRRRAARRPGAQGLRRPEDHQEQWQALHRDAAREGLDAIDGDLVLDRSDFALPRHDAGAFDDEPLQALQRRARRAARQLQGGAARFAPDAAPRSVDVSIEPPLPRRRAQQAAGARSTAPAATGARDCEPAFDDQAIARRCGFAGRYPASCGERDWYVALLDHPHYVHGDVRRRISVRPAGCSTVA